MPKMTFEQPLPSGGPNRLNLLHCHARELNSHKIQRKILAPFHAKMIKDIECPGAMILILNYLGELWLRSRNPNSLDTKVYTKVDTLGIQSPIRQIVTMANDGKLLLLTENNSVYFAILNLSTKVFTASARLIYKGVNPIISIANVADQGYLLLSADGQLCYFKSKRNSLDPSSVLQLQLIPVQNGYRAQQIITDQNMVSVLTEAELQIFEYSSDDSWIFKYAISLEPLKEKVIQFSHMNCQKQSSELLWKNYALLLTESGQVWFVNRSNNAYKINLMAMRISEYSAKKVCYMAVHGSILTFITNNGECWSSQYFTGDPPPDLELREIDYAKEGLVRNITKIKFLTPGLNDILDAFIFTNLSEVYYIGNIWYSSN